MSERGQASVELLAALPLLIALGLAAMQLLAVGYAKVQAGSAAEAAALALVAGGDPEAAAKESLPGWARARADIETSEDEVEISLQPPSLLHTLRERLEVRATAAVEAAP